MNLPEKLVRRYEAIMMQTLSRFGGDPDFEELAGRARLHVWTALSQIPPDRQLDAGGLVRVATRQAAYTYMRREKPKQDRLVPLAAVTAGEQLAAWRIVEPDFAPAVIDRLWLQEVLRGVKATLSEREWQLVADFYARRIQASATERMRVYRWLNRYRREVGEPDRMNKKKPGYSQAYYEKNRARLRDEQREYKRRNRDKVNARRRQRWKERSNRCMNR